MLDVGNRARAAGVESVNADRRELLTVFGGAAGDFYGIAVGIAAAKLPKP
jgi:hypothetical protein